MLHSLRSFTTARAFSFQSSIINLQQEQEQEQIENVDDIELASCP